MFNTSPLSHRASEELRASEKEKSEVLAELQAAVTALSEKENKCLSEKIRVDQQLREFDSDIKEQAKSKAHWERELRKLKLRDIPGAQPNAELKKYEASELEGIDLGRWQYELNLMEENLAQQKPNLAIIEEFRRKEAQYLERVNELEEITARRDRQRKNQVRLRLKEVICGEGRIFSQVHFY
jgi:structural maintenance of chromosome 4